MVNQQLDNGSRMSREAHVRFCKRLTVKPRLPTYPQFLKVRNRGLFSKSKTNLLTTKRKRSKRKYCSATCLFHSDIRIYEKIEMVRCRLERRARFFFADAKKNSPCEGVAKCRA
ncbi:hypothetical protein BWD12_01800 [Leptospira santarosai serovar Bananal]|nr:hypothetical protein BWD12_01800 [Leptospira santarosai serovar Bananal]